MRDAVSMLDQLVASDSEITAERVQAALGMGSMQWVSKLIDALCDANAAAGLETINRALDEGADARQFARQIVEQLRSVMLIKMGDATSIDLPGEQRSIMLAQADRIGLDRLISAVKLFNQAALDLRGGWQPQLPLELALIESLHLQTSNVTVTSSTPKPIQAPPKSSSAQSAIPKPKVDTTSKEFATAAAAPQISTPSTAALTLDEINSHWADILSEVKAQSIPTEALMKSCHVFGIEGTTIVLSWPTGALKEKFESDKVQRQVENAMSAVLDRAVLIRSQIDDPVVREALRLGAKVTPISNR